MQILFTVVKLVLISAIIIGGFVEIAKGNTENFENAFEGTNPSISAWERGLFHRCLCRCNSHYLIFVSSICIPMKGSGNLQRNVVV